MNVCLRQRHCDDFLRFTLNPNVELTPSAAFIFAMYSNLPVAFTEYFVTASINENVYRPRPIILWNFHI